MKNTNNKTETTYSVLKTLRKIVRAIDLHSKKLVQDYGLTVPQIIILKELLNHNTIPVGDLARNVDLSHATVTSILDRLEKLNYIERLRCTNDRRKVLININNQGKEKIQNIPSLLQDRFVKEFSNLKDWEQNLVLSSLQRVASMMDAVELDVAPLLSSEPIEQKINKNLL